MPSCIADLGQSAAAGQGMADESVPAAEAVAAKRLTCCEEPTTEGVALEGLATPVGLHRADERVGVATTLGDPFRPPRDEVPERPPHPTKAERGDCGHPLLILAQSIVPRVRLNLQNEPVALVQPRAVQNRAAARRRA